MWPDQLSGPVDVCVSLPRLELDRPFTYLLTEEARGGMGSLVSVPFHGRTAKGWVLGPAVAVPDGRLLSIRKVRSPVRFFDPKMLELFRWMSERYIAPLATVIERSHPPRVAGEEFGGDWASGDGAAVDSATPARSPSARSRGAPGAYARPLPATQVASTLTNALTKYGGQGKVLEPGGVVWLRPLPGEEGPACVAAVVACLAGGRRAVVIVPESDPLPGTAVAVLDALGDRAVLFAGGAARTRYRTWLAIRRGGFDVVVGTRPAVFAPLPNVGLLWISREVHPGHREERAPYYHVRDVAMARSRIERAACVLASLAPSVETAAGVREGTVRAARPRRSVERSKAPLVETVLPEAEDRSHRLSALLKNAGSAALILSRRGYGIARVCRACGEPAACAVCRGPILVDRAGPRCRLCSARGACANCGASNFGVERGGTERIAEWAERIGHIAVAVERPGSVPPPPRPGRVLVGTAAAVKDIPVEPLELVAILDADRALARPGIHAGEQALATWMEAAAWAGPRTGPARVLLHTRQPGHPAVQALVRWDPVWFLESEGRRRSDAGLPAGHPLFRITGTTALEPGLREAGFAPVVTTASEGGTICLAVASPEAVPALRAQVLRLAERGVVSRVEAEPTL